MRSYKTLVVCLTALICASGISFAQSKECKRWVVQIDTKSCDSDGKKICIKEIEKLKESLNKNGCIQMVADSIDDLTTARNALSKAWPANEGPGIKREGDTIIITKKQP